MSMYVNGQKVAPTKTAQVTTGMTFKSVTYNNTTFVDHVDEILNMANKSTSKRLLSVEFKLANTLTISGAKRYGFYSTDPYVKINDYSFGIPHTRTNICYFMNYNKPTTTYEDVMLRCVDANAQNITLQLAKDGDASMMATLRIFEVFFNYIATPNNPVDVNILTETLDTLTINYFE